MPSGRDAVVILELAHDPAGLVGPEPSGAPFFMVLGSR